MNDDYFEGSELILKNIGKKIEKVTLTNEKIDRKNLPTIHIIFEDKTWLEIIDDGQACCENRYITTDDDLNDLIGKEFQNIEISKVCHDVEVKKICGECTYWPSDNSGKCTMRKETGSEDFPACSHFEKDYKHELSFLRIHAGGEICTFETHVEHNGYYGGFDVKIKEYKEELWQK